MSKQFSEEELQKLYYARTAANYDAMHVAEGDEHYLSLCFMVSILNLFGIRSILDIGSGTGRVSVYIKTIRPDVKVVGVEPVNELREIGYQKGLRRDELIEGDATQLHFGNGEFDLVCEFGALHHMKHPELAVAEMLRVSRKAIFISDSNNFGQGTLLMRALKQAINSFGLWKVADFIRTKGKSYIISEGDGLAYSYSVFNNYEQIRKECDRLHFLNTMNAGWDLYRTAGHVALLGVKGQRSK